MIRFADSKDKPAIRQMWKLCFDDSEEFMDLYFREKYKSENTLVYSCDEKIVSSLQMLPYTITFYGKKIPFYYLSGLCTLPEYRSKGFMKRLIEAAHHEMKKRKIPLAVLIPAEKELFHFYEQFGYEQVFEADEKLIPLKKILTEHPIIEDAYTVFDLNFQQKDFCVQKTMDDFKTIVDEYKIDGCPPKTNLSGMARIIDAEYLFNLYKESVSASGLKLSLLNLGELSSIKSNELKADVRILCRLLFGFKTKELDENFQLLFPERQPIMNLMLE